MQAITYAVEFTVYLDNVHFQYSDCPRRVTSLIENLVTKFSRMIQMGYKFDEKEIKQVDDEIYQVICEH